MKVTADLNGTTQRQMILFDDIDTWIKAEGVLLSSIEEKGRRELHHVLQAGSIVLHRVQSLTMPGPDGADLVFDQECRLDYRGERVFTLGSRTTKTGEDMQIRFELLADVPGIWEALLRQRVAKFKKQ